MRQTRSRDLPHGRSMPRRVAACVRRVGGFITGRAGGEPRGNDDAAHSGWRAHSGGGSFAGRVSSAAIAARGEATARRMAEHVLTEDSPEGAAVAPPWNRW